MRHKAIYDIYSNVKYISQDIAYDVSDNVIHIDESLVQAKIAELEAAQPMRLLRIQRNQILQETDWEVQRNTERNITDSNLISYRNALRDLPQEIENGNIPVPTLDENGMLVFDDWPTRGEQNA